MKLIAVLLSLAFPFSKNLTERKMNYLSNECSLEEISLESRTGICTWWKSALAHGIQQSNNNLDSLRIWLHTFVLTHVLGHLRAPKGPSYALLTDFQKIHTICHIRDEIF